MRRSALALVLVWASAAWGGLRVARIEPAAIDGLEAAGQVADPRLSPDGRFLGYEFMGEDGESLEVYTAPLEGEWGVPARFGTAAPVLPSRPADPFLIPSASRRPVSEGLSWGPSKRGKPRAAVAATRVDTSRGAAQVSFDLYLSEPGRRRFVAEHPENDAQPTFSPDGEFLAFSSGRTGQGDIYLYHFFAESDPLVRVSYEAGGSEIYAAWDAAGERLAYTGHLAGEDHILVVDEVRSLAREPDPSRRAALARRRTRDLTPGWRVSCLAASFSPDGAWVAFYAREGRGERADLFVVPSGGGEPRRLLSGGLPETRGGPRWAPDGDGLFAVRDDAQGMNPLVWVPLAEGSSPAVLATGTELNADPYPWKEGETLYLLFTAQGGSGGDQKRWRRIYVARLARERGR